VLGVASQQVTRREMGFVEWRRRAQHPRDVFAHVGSNSIGYTIACFVTPSRMSRPG
jgi:hypothetical protein